LNVRTVECGPVAGPLDIKPSGALALAAAIEEVSKKVIHHDQAHFRLGGNRTARGNRQSKHQQRRDAA
jgi:hypothetical protein